MAELEAILNVTELATISVACPTCANEVLFKLSTDPARGFPFACPTCRDPWDGFRRVFQAYRTFYTLALDAQTPVQLRVKLPGAALRGG